MTDITKCDGLECDIKHFCFRYTAEDGPLQSYFFEVPKKKDEACTMFWDNTTENRVSIEEFFNRNK